MKTAGRENPNRWVIGPNTRVHGAAVQSSSHSISWAGKQEKLRPREMCFFLTSPFIELHRTWPHPNLRRTRSHIPLSLLTLSRIPCQESNFDFHLALFV